jgi:hypothetical protein
MLQNNRTTLISSFVAVGILALASACGGSDEGDDGGGSSTPDQPCTDCATPPAAPAAGATGDGPGAVLAVNKLFLGDTDRQGSPSQTAWKDFGYDLDGFKSTKNSVTHCKLNGDVNPSAIKTDGTNGIDNSFGANIVPVIAGVASDAAQRINETLEEGSFTIILEVKTVGGGKDYVNLPAALYAGASLLEESGAGPNWDGNDEWPVFCELMNDCKDTGTTQFPDATSKVKFPSSYMAGGTWVSGSKGTVNLSLSIQGFSLSLDINQAVVTADMSGNPPTSATNGMIAGVIEAQKLVDSLSQIAGSISPSLCGDSPTLQSVKASILGASDIMKNGTQDPAQVCDGISVGLGFDMKAVKLGTVMDKNQPGPDPCLEQ